MILWVTKIMTAMTTTALATPAPFEVEVVVNDFKNDMN
jgi:hypothetical protein